MSVLVARRLPWDERRGANEPGPFPNGEFLPTGARHCRIPESVHAEMLISPFNDPNYLRSLLAEHGDEIAGIIVEPLRRIIPPEPGFLQILRDEADKYGIVLIFDEVVTGFRFAYGGTQGLYGVAPDVATLGMIIGGGFPLAVIAGRADIMAHFDKATVGADKWLMQLDSFLVTLWRQLLASRPWKS